MSTSGKQFDFPIISSLDEHYNGGGGIQIHCLDKNTFDKITVKI